MARERGAAGIQMLIHHRANTMSEHGPFCFRNNTDDPVNGLHVIFTGGGRLRGGRITVGPPGRITTVDNQLNVFLNDVLAPGMVLCLTVSSAHPLHQHAAYGKRKCGCVERPRKQMPAKSAYSESRHPAASSHTAALHSLPSKKSARPSACEYARTSDPLHVPLPDRLD